MEEASCRGVSMKSSGLSLDKGQGPRILPPGYCFLSPGYFDTRRKHCQHQKAILPAAFFTSLPELVTVLYAKLHVHK